MADRLRNMKRRIGQRLVIGFDGTTLPADVVRLDEEWGLGGYILFKRNLQSMAQIIDLNEELWALGQGVPPFIGIDHEGGRVNRLPEPFTKFAQMSQLGKLNSVSVAYEVGAIISRELTAVGFNLNFAPVLDLNTNPDNPIIGRRSISDDPALVTRLAKAVIRGLHDNAVIACGKHFPGHGDTREDSHETLPTCNLTLDTMRGREMKPFIKLSAESPHLSMIMTAHVKYPKIDPNFPATLSRILLQDILRLELGYKGLVITDDLEMKAISDTMSIEDATVAAIEAGNDILMVCHSIEKQVAVLETMMKLAESGKYPRHLWDKGFKRVRNVKAEHFRVVRTLDRQHARELVGNREHARISRRLKDGR